MIKFIKDLGAFKTEDEAHPVVVEVPSQKNIGEIHDTFI